MLQANKKTTIEYAQLKHLLSVNNRTVLASAILALMLAWIESDVIPTSILMVWLSVMLLVNVVRVALCQYQLKYPTFHPNIIKQRLNLFRVGLMFSSIMWGVISLIVIDYGLLEHQLFVSYVIAGLSAGAVVSYSIDRISAMTYLFFAVLPTLLGFIWVGHEISIPMAFAGFVYMTFSIYSIYNYHRNLVESILLRRQAVEREEEIKRLAFYDVLTNLPNRRLLMDRLQHALVMSRRSGKRGALLFLDLDHFKMLNDTLGHSMGDLLLMQVADRLKQCVRESDTVARLGGDEFVVMLEDLSEDGLEATREVALITSQMLARLNLPYQLGDFEYISTPSIGVAMFSEHGESHDELLKHADIAMYQAKKSGRNVVRVFDFDMRSDVPVKRKSH
ncbi:MAG: GGDEF domain-containing protein [Methylophilus sp.]|nr:GGDEF domain-containing protein [Methylophilus sp.]